MWPYCVGLNDLISTSITSVGLSDLGSAFTALVGLN